MNRVVITGLGFISSLGLGTDDTWKAMLLGRTGLGPLRHLAMPGEPAQLAAEVDLPSAPPGVRRPSRCLRLALVSLDEALATAGLDLDHGDPRRRGVYQGAPSSGLPAAEAYALDRLAGRRGQAAEAVWQTPNVIADALAERLGALGPRSTIMNACSSSLMALGQAWEAIAMGELDWALAGGAEALCRTTYAGFSALKAMDPKPCRPFSADRAGMNLGEGSAQLMLESLDHARARGARILGEVLGYGASMDGHHATAPHPEGAGAARAMVLALRTAHLLPGEVDLVSAHATATPANDAAECSAIKTALGPAAARISVTASKSQFGHTLAAAGAVGAAVALMSLRDQVVPPTLRLETPDPACDLDCTPKVAKERPLRAALVNAFAFGGNNVSLVLKRWEGA